MHDVATPVPHHDGSALYVPEGVPALGDTVPVRVRVPRSAGVRDVWLRTVRDGEPRLAPARLDRSDEHEDWYVAEVLVHNPVTGYRFFLDEGERGYRWLNGREVWDRDVPDAADFRLTVHEGAPAWMRDGVVYQVFPDRFARSAGADGRPLPEWAVPAAWDDEPRGAGPDVGTQYYGGDLAGVEERLDHLVALGVTTLYTTPVFPGRSNHRYAARTFDHGAPLRGGVAASAAERVGAAGWWSLESDRWVVVEGPDGGNAPVVTTVLLCLVAVAAVTLGWVGPLTHLTRYGTRTALARLAPGRTGTLVLAGLGLVLTVVSLVLLGGDPGVTWWPFPGPPSLR